MVPSPRLSRSWLPGVALIVAVFIAYALALRGGFLWDDDMHVSANPTIIGPLGLREIWTTARANYFPLVLTNFWVQHALWGLNPIGYHLVTLAFHAAAAVLLWRVLLALRVPGAWLGAAIWALHPVQTESVAWICELKNTQSAVFFLGSIYFFVRWVEGTTPRPGDPSPAAARPEASPYLYALSLGCAVLALLSKPSTVMLPVALVLCAWWVGARLERRTLIALVPFFALSAIAAGWTIWEQKFHSGASGAEWSQTIPERCVVAGRVIWFYLGKLAWPWPLTFIYPRWQIHAGNPFAYVPLLLACGGLLLLWRRRSNAVPRAGFFAAAFFVALLFPVLGFFDVFFFRYSYVGDHFQYLSSIGPLAWVGALLTTTLRHRVAPVAGALLVMLAALTAWQTRDYRDTETLWRATLARNPGATMAWVNLGDTVAAKGRYDEALRYFRRALEIKPGMADVHNDIGCTLVLVNRPAEAVPEFKRALALRPDNAEPHNNLGNALRMLGRSDDAIAEYRRAIALRSDYGEAHNNLGAELAERGAPQDALPHFEAALRANPERADVHNNFGNALRRLGRIDEAIAQHREALRLNPKFAEAHVSLGQTLLAAGKPREALPELERAVALNPRFATAQGYLARALELAGRPDEALVHFQQAVAIAPDSAETHNNLGTALAQRGRVEEAMAEFTAAVRAAPEFASARMNLAVALASRGRWSDAVEHFAKAAQLEPASAETHAQLAVALVNAGRLGEAVPEFETSLRLRPDAPEVHNNFAQVLRALGRSREALEHFEAAARTKPRASHGPK